MRRALILCFVLAGCGTVQSAPIIPTGPATQTVVKVVCPTPKTYSSAQEKAIGDAVAALDPMSALVGLVADYGSLRASLRACSAN